MKETCCLISFHVDFKGCLCLDCFSYCYLGQIIIFHSQCEARMPQDMNRILKLIFTNSRTTSDFMTKTSAFSKLRIYIWSEFEDIDFYFCTPLGAVCPGEGGFFCVLSNTTTTVLFNFMNILRWKSKNSQKFVLKRMCMNSPSFIKSLCRVYRIL